MNDEHARPECGLPMKLAHVTPGLGSLPELHTLSCLPCGVVLTEEAKGGRPEFGDRTRVLQGSLLISRSLPKLPDKLFRLLADIVAKVESCRATNFSRKHETESNRRFV